MGNTYNVDKPLDIVPSNGDITWNRGRSIQDKIVSPSTINVTEPPRPATPEVKNRHYRITTSRGRRK